MKLPVSRGRSAVKVCHHVGPAPFPGGVVVVVAPALVLVDGALGVVGLHVGRGSGVGDAGKALTLTRILKSVCRSICEEGLLNKF